MHEDLVATVGAGAVVYSSATRYLRATGHSASTDANRSVDISMAMDDAGRAARCLANIYPSHEAIIPEGKLISR
jgi:hypothetical protein